MTKMTKGDIVLQNMKAVCSDSPMKCHELNYSLVKKQCGLDTKQFSAALNYLKQTGKLKRANKAWVITKHGNESIEASQSAYAQYNETVIQLTSLLKTISEDLRVFQRCKISPSNEWMAKTRKDIDCKICS